MYKAMWERESARSSRKGGVPSPALERLTTDWTENCDSITADMVPFNRHYRHIREEGIDRCEILGVAMNRCGQRAGLSDDEVIWVACQRFQEEEGRDFRFRHWVSILHERAEFRPTIVRPLRIPGLSPLLPGDYCSRDRFESEIEPDVLAFNKYYKEIKMELPSSSTDPYCIELAARRYLESEGKPFRFKWYMATLHKLDGLRPTPISDDERTDFFNNQIKPEILVFNKHYVEIKQDMPMGMLDCEYIQLSADRYNEVEGKQFRWKDVVHTLYQEHPELRPNMDPPQPEVPAIPPKARRGQQGSS